MDTDEHEPHPQHPREASSAHLDPNTQSSRTHGLRSPETLCTVAIEAPAKGTGTVIKVPCSSVKAQATNAIPWLRPQGSLDQHMSSSAHAPLYNCDECDRWFRMSSDYLLPST